MIVCSALSPDDWRQWRELRFEALREAPYAYGSTLADWQGEYDTEVRWRRRLSDVPFNVMARFDGKPAGIVSATAPADASVELISLWVAPFARGRGVGDILVNTALQWCRSLDVREVRLAVVPTNANAIALYRRHGFVDSGFVDGELTMTLAGF